MRNVTTRALLAASAMTATAMAGGSPALAAAQALTSADRAAAFTAAGFKRQGRQWRSCDDPGTASYAPGAIDDVRDVNADGRPEAIVTESSTYCYGMEGSGYAIVSKQADGKWKLMNAGSGMPRFLAVKGAGGWPDLEIGGPGFCFPVLRWNGRSYEPHRHEYQGKRCRR